MSSSTVSFHNSELSEKVQTSYSDRLDKLRKTFASGRTKTLQWRLHQLTQLKVFLEENVEECCKVLTEDLRKSRNETILFEIETTVNEIKGALMDVPEWIKPEAAAKNIMTLFDKPYIWNEPFGLCLIMGAWNYPVHLAIAPMIGAIAAGNAIVLKPSDMAPATAKFLEKLKNYLDTDAIDVINGGIPETTELLKERFDHIFYTGSTNIGKIIYASAQKYMTPVVLELGGKSPVYLDPDVNLDVATKRILWGKWINAGQTCVAPDYVLCPESIYDRFLENCKSAWQEFYSNDPKSSKDFGRIIHQRHVKRLEGLLNGADIVFGGEIDVDQKYVAPTVIKDVKATDSIMGEEIFGPILPVVKVADMTEAIQIINSREKPLTAYVFSKNKRIIDRFIRETTSGSVCANDVLLHLSLDSLPFGGIGASGLGRYHGKFSFDCFSNKKAVLERDYNPIGEHLGKNRYPPTTEGGLKLFTFLMAKRYNPLRFVCKVAPYVIGAAIGIAATLGTQYWRKHNEV